MSITIQEGLMLYKAGRSILHGLRNAVSNLGNQGPQAASGADFRKLLLEKTAAQSGSKSIAGTGAPTLPQAAPRLVPQSKLAASLAEFEGGLGKLFRGDPIDTSRPLVVELRDGKLTVANDHPDKARIEALFERFPGLAQVAQGVETELRARTANGGAGQITTFTASLQGVTATLQPAT